MSETILGIGYRTELQIKYHLHEIEKLQAERRAAGLPNGPHGEVASPYPPPPLASGERGLLPREYVKLTCHYCTKGITNFESSWQCTDGKNACNNCASEMLAKEKKK